MYADIVYPDKNEKSFIQIAERLGYTALVFAYPFSDTIPELPAAKKIKLLRAVDAPFSQLNKAKKMADFVFYRQDKNTLEVFERGLADVVYGFGMHERYDPIHQRASELNQILCRLAAKNKISIGLSFRSFLSAPTKQQPSYLGRLAQNLLLCRKYKVPLVVGSFAQDPLEMRSPKDIISFFSLAGAHPNEVQQGMNDILTKMSEFSIQSLTGGTRFMFQHSENSEHAQEPLD